MHARNAAAQEKENAHAYAKMQEFKPSCHNALTPLLSIHPMST
jgi:hypothetical protein